jgi:hypothetical protein
VGHPINRVTPYRGFLIGSLTNTSSSYYRKPIQIGNAYNRAPQGIGQVVAIASLVASRV